MGKKWRRLNNADTVMPGDIFVWANGYRDTPSEYWYGHNVNQVMLIYSGISGIERRIKTPRSKWHKVWDELPDNRRDVAVKIEEDNDIHGAWLDGEPPRSWHVIGMPCADVTHWRELPKFKEERDT